MILSEFQNKYSNEISEFEKTTGRYAIRTDGFTKAFLEYLQQQNIKITYKPPKILIPKCYNHIYNISEFWLKFLRDHTYFSKKQAIEDYIREYYSPKNRCDDIKREFNNLIRYFLKYGIVERYSRFTYKINKELVNKYS